MSINEQKPYHHDNLRRQLIDATVELLKEDEISQLSMRKVAKKVGVSHNALYRHFSDKNALLEVVAEEGFMMFRDALQAAVDQYPNQPLKQLQNSGVAYVEFALKNPSYFRLMFGAYRTSPIQNLPNLAQKQEDMSTILVEQLVQGVQSNPTGFNVKGEAFMVLLNTIFRCQQAGLMKTDNPKTQALACWSIVHGLAMLLLDGQILINEEQLINCLSTLMIQFLVEGLGDRPCN
jgi:AcrR family transcriptional regulator